MAGALRICLFDQGVPETAGFREPFDEFHDVYVVGEFDEWGPLQEALLSGAVDMVAVNLDAADESSGINMVQRIAEVAPDCGLIGVSRSSDPETIIAAMRAGCGQFVRWPIDQSDLRAAIDRLCAKSRRNAEAPRQICVIGSSGGAGTTTIACNLAMEFANITGRQCGLVDLNLEFGDIACAFDFVPKYSIADVCRDGVEIDRMMLETVLEELPCNVCILPRPENIEDVREVTPEGLEHMLRLMSQLFPYITLDLPRSFSFLSAAAVRGADRTLIVTQLAVPYLRNAKRIYNCLLQMGTSEDRIEIVLNRCNANFERIRPEEVEHHFRRPIFGIVPNDYRHVTASRDLGHPIVSEAPDSPARKAIAELARKIAGESLEEEEPEARGFFGMFRKRKPARK